MVKVGVDVGGTFTDIVCVKSDGTLFGAKVSSTPNEVMVGVLNAVDTISDVARIDREAIGMLVHSSTVATNAILEGKAARIGMLMTAGFEDVIEIGKQSRSKLYDLFLDPETPSFIAPRRMRRGVEQRIDARGQEVVPLNEADVVESVRYLVEQQRVEAIAVCYLFSFRNPDHERRTLELIRAVYPKLPVSLSSEVMPVTREYRRACVTAFDSAIRPVVQTYLTELQDALKSNGRSTRLEIMLSRGGLGSVDRAIRRPAMMIASGPAATVIGAQIIGEEVRIGDFVSIDIGGTSADVSMVTAGRARRTTESCIKGYPMPLPTIDVVSIGAGGGSIAWFDDGGGLHVGPQSAGSRPGPACYPDGGRDATVTDASLVLGYLNPTNFANGSLPLDVAAARRVIGEAAERLGLGLAEAASGIHRVLNARMADQVRLLTLMRGHDPSGLWLLAGGGGGAVHASALARDLRMRGVIVPTTPGLIAARGLLVADIEHDYARTVHLSASELDLQYLNDEFGAFEKAGYEELARDGVQREAIEFRASVDIRYVGQSYEIEVPIDYPVTPESVSRALGRFHQEHEFMYGHAKPDDPTEILNLRATLSARTPRPRVEHRPSGRAVVEKARRPVYFAELGEYVDTPVYDRNALPVAGEVRGPAVLEQADTTTVLLPGDVCTVHETGHLLIRQSGVPQ